MGKPFSAGAPLLCYPAGMEPSALTVIIDRIATLREALKTAIADRNETLATYYASGSYTLSCLAAEAEMSVSQLRIVIDKAIVGKRKRGTQLPTPLPTPTPTPEPFTRLTSNNPEEQKALDAYYTSLDASLDASSG